MDVRESDVAGMPAGNIRAPRDEFVTVWREAARRSRELGSRGVTDWYLGAVAVTCRWMAGAPTRTARSGGLTRSPATRRTVLAYEELIEAEFLAAERLEELQPDLATTRPGWCAGVRATLRWAWRWEGPPPLALEARAAG